MENPLEHFELHTLILLRLFGLDISINQAVVMIWVVCAAVFLFFWAATRNARLIPTKLQSIAELGVEFLRGLILENMGEKGMKLFPFIATLFFFILFSNLLGLIPGAYTVTSQVMVNGILALAVFALSVIMGVALHGAHYLSIFLPQGTPWWLMPLMILVEIISQLARPITLAVRLFANMTAGHTVINVLLGLVLLGGVVLGWMPLGFTVALYLLEVLVAFIQAYVFTVLTTVYIGDAIKLH
ncbi:MAG: F0F1 ATP synthase subunit A [Nitrospirae bacterium]|nr:F0F1 ATP synthase subunit A [Nitrospirota bacterium]